jgi:hypothetical protein
VSALRFDGRTYDEQRDGERLTTMFQAVRDLLLDGEWRTLREIAEEIGGSEASVSARLRDLRKPRFGGYIVRRSYRSNGVWIYRVEPPDSLF